MFGNFLEQFGLNFQLQDQNAQGGLFGTDIPQTAQQPPAAGVAAGNAGTTGLSSAPPPGVAPPPGAAPPGFIGAPNSTNPAALSGQSPTAPSPLANPLAPGGMGGAFLGQTQPPPTTDPAPAAGVGNQFNKVGP
jgi:hypothetical protein